MTITHSRTTKLEVRSEDRYEEIDLGVVRRFVAECDEAGLSDGVVVEFRSYGDHMHYLVADVTGREELPSACQCQAFPMASGEADCPNHGEAVTP